MDNNNTNAKLFAIAAHEAVGQKRKYSGQPYYTHPVAVASIVEEYGGNAEQIQAALLHDVVEDTNVTIDIIREHFGDTIADLVDWLTDTSKPEDGNRATRKAIDRKHIQKASQEAQFIKCADLIHNTECIIKNDKKFAVVYMEEKALLLDSMTKVHNTPIWNKAKEISNDYYKNNT
jgi:(p)ppGpp synthase/HD superfamily hydrolase